MLKPFKLLQRGRARRVVKNTSPIPCDSVVLSEYFFFLIPYDQPRISVVIAAPRTWLNVRCLICLILKICVCNNISSNASHLEDNVTHLCIKIHSTLLHITVLSDGDCAWTCYFAILG